MIDIKALSDAELTELLHDRVARERDCSADVVEALAEFDRRRLAERRRSDLFVYCRQDLLYSEGAAYKRIRAARATLKYPSILNMLRNGSVSLAAVNILAPHLTSENHQRLLRRAQGQSKRNVEAIVAEIAPAAEPREVIRRIGRQPISTPPEESDPLFAQESVPAAATPGVAAAGGGAAGAQSTPPLEDRVYFSFTASKEVEAKIERCRQLLRHKYGKVRLEHVIAESVEALLDIKDRARRRAGPPRRRSNPESRSIPEWVKQRVWLRDGGRCTFTTDDGLRCDTRDFLEFDHVKPFAVGGASNDPANIRLRCRPHNQLEARKWFGDKAVGRPEAHA